MLKRSFPLFKPDIVFPKFKTVVFIHGCFWHMHNDCKIARIPKSNTGFWIDKLNHNVENDKKNTQLLEVLGWKVLTVWECEIEKDIDAVVQRIIHELEPNKS